MQQDEQSSNYFDEMTQRRNTYMRKGSIDTHVDISAIDDEARKNSWNRIMKEKLETVSQEQFESNLRSLSQISNERRSQISGLSSLTNRSTKITKKTSITVVVADMDISLQHKIEQELPLILQNGIVGYDLCSLVDLAMDVYDLDPEYGVQVDYWSNSHQSYFICDIDLFQHRASIASSGQRSMQSLVSNQPAVRHVICEEDLEINNEGKPCLRLRFKNCTGNVIILDDKQPTVSENEFAQAQIAISIDSQFKN